MSKLNHDFPNGISLFDQSCFNGSVFLLGCGDIGKCISVFHGYVGIVLDIGTGEQSSIKCKEMDEVEKGNPL